MNFIAELKIRKARKYIRAGNLIPLDLFAELIAYGVDVTELERTTRNEIS